MPPELFTAARDELAKRLKAADEPDAATRVKAFKRPTVPAWALNQLVRRNPDAIEELLQVGERLRAAQLRALSRSSGGGLVEAGDTRRRLIARLTKQTAAILEESGRSATPHVNDIASTLEASSAEEEAGRQLANGRLSNTLAPQSTFGQVLGLRAVPDLEVAGVATQRRTASRRGPAADEVREAREEVQRLRRGAREAERASAASAKQLERARRALEEARERVRTAEAEARGTALHARSTAKDLQRAEARLGRSHPSKG